MAAEPLPSDPLFADQWHLDSRGHPDARVDLNVVPVWNDYTGAGVTVAIMDTPIEASHPDLAGTYDPALHMAGDPYTVPTFWEAVHGTSIAGLIAAGRNGFGTVGVAYGASIAGLPIFWHDRGMMGPSRVAQMMAEQDRFDVANHSWSLNFAFAGGVLDPDWAAFHAGLAEAVALGRGGLGTIVVAAAGNDSLNTNLSGFTAARSVVTVGAVGPDGLHAHYSAAGATVLVVAPSGATINAPGSITTTDRTGEPGRSPGDYTDSFGGTSTSAALVSGVAALLLEANPLLGWRDVQEILALTARHTGTAIGGPLDPLERHPWIFNAGQGWNGGGLHFSDEYGFGLVDARAAVRLAETWQKQSTSANEASAAVGWSGRIGVPDGGAAGRTFTLTLTEDLRIEHVALRLDIDMDLAYQLDIRLLSPGGTESRLHPATGGFTPFVDWVFGSNEVRGEGAAGTWQVVIVDTTAGQRAFVERVELTAYGAAAVVDDLHVYTDEYADYAALPGRALLQDAGGHDVLNAAAVTADLTLDLRPGTVGNVAGTPLTIASGTWIEEAIAGDGNDRIFGNARDNLLSGMRGDDRLAGLQGADSLMGGSGDDQLTGGAGADRLDGGDGRDSVVYLSPVVLDLVFGDKSSGEAQGDSFLDVERFLGSGSGDRLLGSGAGEELVGRGGDDLLTGRAGADRLLGGAGADSLTGGAGSDTLAGGDGADLFILAVGGGADRLLDFVPGEDAIRLQGSGLPGGTLPAAGFALAGAVTPDSRIVYDPLGGSLWLDPDGSGAAAPLLLATLGKGLALGAGDILLA